MSLTQGLGKFVAHPRFTQVPDELVPTIRNAFIDTVACLFSGRQEAVTQAALRLVRQRGSSEQVHVLLGTEKLSVIDTAFVNAVSAHALDYDDMALNGHPSVVLVPALLAAGEMQGATDQALLRAYLVGYEVWAELVGREPDSLHNKGWHPTSVIGTVATAAAIAHLEGLSAEQASHALGIAASMSSGLMGNFGSMTKPLHAGWAAAHGIESVQLASYGVTASAHVLESDVGYLAAISPQGKADRSAFVPSASLRFHRSGLSIKKYPVCYAAHRVIDGVIDVRRAHSFDAKNIKRILPSLSHVTAKVLHSHRPTSALQAKFSIEFACAMAALEGAVGLAHVTDSEVNREDIQALIRKVEVETVEPGCPIEPGFALYDRVRIELVDGTMLDSGPIRYPRGHAQCPLPQEDITEKWMGCLAEDQDKKLVFLDVLAQMASTNSKTVTSFLRAGIAGREC